MARHFTVEDTLNEILKNAKPAFRLFFPESLLAFVPEEYRDLPLRRCGELLTMPWGVQFPAEEVAEEANIAETAGEDWNWIPLWSEEGFTVDTNDSHSVCLVQPKELQGEGRRPAAVICPGGGYENLAFHGEGLLIAEKTAQAGIRPFILSYRYSPNRYPDPQADLALAIMTLRANSEKYQIDPDHIRTVGFSAGGHLCASEAAFHEEAKAAALKQLQKSRPDLAQKCRDISARPDQVCLGYPVISFMEEDHEPSFQALTGGNEELREHLSIEKQVTSDYPKCYVWTCADDSLVPPSNTVRMGKALEEHNVPSRVRIYPQGEHGCCLGIGTSAEGWFEDMTEFFRQD